jgi:serine/threonine protein kinase
MKPEPDPLHDAPTLPLPRTGSAGEASLAAGDGERALRAGTRLGEFELLRVLGCGGFGIVYLARDHSLLRTVAIKEYLPEEFARRAANGSVVARSGEDASTFAMGLRSFVREARLLAGFDHPALVKVHRFWEANGTAYMAMPYYGGRTLKDVRRTLASPPDEAWLRTLLDPLLAALEVLHAADVIHRDLSPDNVLLLDDGRPLLLDFGSARFVLADRTQALTAVFKPSFGAIEQYGDTPGLRQGPWTDLYALGGVVHYLVTGAAPKPAALRAVDDGARDALSLTAEKLGYSRAFVVAIEWALHVRPQDRPQSVAAFRAALAGETRLPRAPAANDEPRASIAATANGEDEGAVLAARSRPPRRHGRTWLTLLGLALAVVVVLGIVRHRAHPPRAADAASAVGRQQPAVAEGPRATCAGETGLRAKATCWERMCRDPAWTASAECDALRQRARAGGWRGGERGGRE